MKSIKNYIIESQQSYINDFIDFLLKNSKEGELKTNHKSYYDYFNECDPFDNPKFSRNIGEMELSDEYCEKHNIDSIYDDEENFINYVKDIVDEYLTLDFERGLIKIERVIDITSSFAKYKGNIGKYWTFIEGAGDSYGASSYKNNITICALVDPKDVDWGETMAANLSDPDECELTLNEDAPIQITKILDVNRKLIIEKNILYKA